MALTDQVQAVHRMREGSVRDSHLLRTEPHGAPEIGLLVARLNRALQVLPLADERDHRVWTTPVELGAVGPRETGDVACEFDDRELHSEADTEVRDAVDARVTNRLDLAFDPALTEPARHQNRVHPIELVATMPLQVLRLDEIQVDPRAGTQARVHQRLAERDVRIAQIYVLADHRDSH